MRLVNDRTHRSIADAVEVADTAAARRRGLLGRADLAEGSALMLIPCFAIHTARMRFAIDVVFLDRNGCVVRTVARLAPWRIAIAWRGRSVVELPAGCLERTSVQPGDYLYVAPSCERRRAS